MTQVKRQEVEKSLIRGENLGVCPSQHPDVAEVHGNMTDEIIMWITTDTNKNLS